MVDAITSERRARAAATTTFTIRCASRMHSTHLDIFRNTNEHRTESTLRSHRDPPAIPPRASLCHFDPNALIFSSTAHACQYHEYKSVPFKLMMGSGTGHLDFRQHLAKLVYRTTCLKIAISRSMHQYAY